MIVIFCKSVGEDARSPVNPDEWRTPKILMTRFKAKEETEGFKNEYF
jgi:hypothetical protein